MNKNIITEFTRLVAFLENELELGKDLISNRFRLKQVKNVLNILTKFPNKITKSNYLDLKEISGIGKGTIERIKEILTNKKLLELEGFVDNNIEKKKALENLESVVGIGHSHALELYNQGITSVKDLKKKIKTNEIDVNEKILLGLKYYGKFEGNIPRKEIDKIYKIFKELIKNLNKKLKANEKYIFEFCGSYRREKLTSGDIDILISKKGVLNNDFNYLASIVDLLKLPNKNNNNNAFLIDDLTELGKTKYMGFGKYLDNYVRRIDIRFIPYESYYSALLYFTGSAELNKKMRQIAKNKKLKLSEYGLYKENGEKIIINSEQDIFDILEIDFLEPKLR